MDQLSNSVSGNDNTGFREPHKVTCQRLVDFKNALQMDCDHWPEFLLKRLPTASSSGKLEPMVKEFNELCKSKIV